MPVTRGRAAGFPSPLPPAIKSILVDRVITADRLPGVALRYREILEGAIDESSRRPIGNLKASGSVPLVVGGGLHAAIFSAEFWRKTGKKPIVIDKRPRLGGAFAISTDPAFYLNSRNRPERDGGPGMGGSLNSIGGLVELSDLSGLEYPSQDLFAYAIRLNLSLYARAYARQRLRRIVGQATGGYQFETITSSDATTTLRTQDLILATGLGEPVQPIIPGVLNFSEFLERCSRLRRPLEGLDRVAVIGAGDSGASVVEYLIGQGPEPKGSVASRDFPNRIVWFGQGCETKESYEQGARSRYAGIGRYMPREGQPDYYTRVFPKPRAVEVMRGRVVRYRDNRTGEPRVEGPFDLIVVCTGYQDEVVIPKFLLRKEGPVLEPVVVDGVEVATRYVGTRIYRIGPCARIGISDMEKEETPVLAKVPQNSVAAFRYNKRTQAFARYLAREYAVPKEDEQG